MQPENVVKINLDSLIPNFYQPRKAFNETSLNELSLSIKEYGILNPILVRKKEDKYEIIAGERRVRAAKKAGLTEVPAIIKNISDNKLAEIALIENIQRENITPIEEAKSYKEILQLSDITEQKLSEIVGKSQSFISNKLRLLSLPENIQEALINRKISERHARSLLTVKNSEKQTELLERILNEKLTVKELDNIINDKEITKQEVNSAINEIIKTLNNSDLKQNKKEEKESDNMNNGNFFPNFNNNVEPNNNNVSLNTMNMQSIPAAPTAPAVEITPMTYTPEQPTPGVQNLEMPSIEPTMSVSEPAPVVNTNPIPNFGVSEPPTVEQVPVINPPIAPAPQPITTQTEINNNQVADIPLFATENVQTTVNEMPSTAPEAPTTTLDAAMPASPIPAANVAMPDAPLFPESAMQNEAPITATPEPVATPTTYDIPITSQPVEEPDKLSQVKEFLGNNGITYKEYSNETNSCLIIEL